MASLTPQQRWQIGLAVLTAYLGPAARRATDITAVAGQHDPREVVFGVLAVARDLLDVIETSTGIGSSAVLQSLAERRAEAGG